MNTKGPQYLEEVNTMVFQQASGVDQAQKPTEGPKGKGKNKKKW